MTEPMKWPQYMIDHWRYMERLERGETPLPIFGTEDFLRRYPHLRHLQTAKP